MPIVTVYRYFFSFADASVSIIIKGSIIKDLVSDFSEYESSWNKMLKFALLCSALSLNRSSPFPVNEKVHFDKIGRT